MAKLSRNQSNVRAYRNSDGGNVWRRREKKRNAFSLRFFLLGTVSTIRNTSATLTTPASNARTSVKPAECCARTPEALPIQGFALDWHHLSSPHIFTHPSFFVQSLSLSILSLVTTISVTTARYIQHIRRICRRRLLPNLLRFLRRDGSNCRHDLLWYVKICYSSPPVS